MTDQIPLFIEDLEEAVKVTIQALGGFKKVGQMVKPDLSMDAAARWLMDCCNPERPNKFALSELQLLARLGRQVGCHAITAQFNRDAGYSVPQPIEPEDEQAALQRQFSEQSKHMAALFKQMERAGLKVVA